MAVKYEYTYTTGISLPELVGKTLTEVSRCDDGIGQYGSNDGIVFVLENGDKYALSHNQSCCENVFIKDVVGDLEDLVGTPILVSEHRCEDVTPEDDSNYGDYTEWNFYEFRTIKGSVTIQFQGTDNGYYGRDAQFERVKDVT